MVIFMVVPEADPFLRDAGGSTHDLYGCGGFQRLGQAGYVVSKFNTEPLLSTTLRLFTNVRMIKKQLLIQS